MVRSILATPYKIVHKDLTLGERARCVGIVAETLIGICVNRKKLSADRVNYLNGNTYIALDVLSFMDKIELSLQQKMKVNVIKLERENDSRALLSISSEEDHTFDSVNTLLGGTSKSSFHWIHKSLMGEFKIGYSSLPSYHMLTKDCPLVQGFTFTEESQHHCNAEDGIININYIIQLATETR